MFDRHPFPCFSFHELLKILPEYLDLLSRIDSPLPFGVLWSDASKFNFYIFVDRILFAFIQIKCLLEQTFRRIKEITIKMFNWILNQILLDIKTFNSIFLHLFTLWFHIKQTDSQEYGFSQHQSGRWKGYRTDEETNTRRFQHIGQKRTTAQKEIDTIH